MARRSLAKAVFDNVAETPNELAFRRGDVLAVISQTVPGLDGWWHCSFRGKQGIAPGNRLQLLAGMYPAEDGDVAGDLQIDSAHSSMIADYDVPRAHTRHEASAGGTGVSSSSARASTDSAFSFSDGLYDQLPPTRGLTSAVAVTSDALSAVTSAEPLKVLPIVGTGAVVPNHQRGKEASRSADAASPPSQQQQRILIRDLTYDVPLSLQQRSGSAAIAGAATTATAASGVGNGISDAAAKRDLRAAVSPLREVDYDIPLALARSRGNGGAMTAPTVAAAQALRGRSPPSSDSQLYDVPQQHRWSPQQQPQQAAASPAPGVGGAAGTRASGLSVASSTTSWSSGCGAEGSTSSGTASARSSLELLDIYDVPRALASAGTDRWLQRRSGGSGDGSSPATVTDELYDELPQGAARPVTAVTGVQQQQRSHVSPTPAEAKGRVSHMKTVVASAADSEVVYDVPPQVVRDSGGMPAPAASGQRTGLAAIAGSDRTCRPATDALPPADGCGTVLPLQLDSAVELLVKLHQDVATAASRLLGLAANEAWRRRQHLEAAMYDVKMACIGVQTNLQEFVDFARGACANVVNRSAGGEGGADSRSVLHAHLSALLAPLEERLQVINKSMKALSSSAKWQASRLAVDAVPAGARLAGDDLDVIVSCTRDGLVEAVGRLSMIVKANAAQIFRKCDGVSSSSGRNNDAQGTQFVVCGGSEGSLPPVQSHRTPSEHLEYDYIELDACDYRVSSAPPTATSAASAGRRLLGGGPITSGDAAELSLLGKGHSPSADNSAYANGCGAAIVGSDDRQFLAYYSCAIGAIVDSVGDANGRLQAAIRRFESAQLLVSLSRDLVVQAHRLVYIGETLSRSLAHASTRGDISNAANELCNCLKNIIVSTKDVLVVDQLQSNKALQVMIGRSNDLQRAVTQFRVAVTRPIAT